jgi:hypothetical protein
MAGQRSVSSRQRCQSTIEVGSAPDEAKISELEAMDRDIRRKISTFDNRRTPSDSNYMNIDTISPDFQATKSTRDSGYHGSRGSFDMSQRGSSSSFYSNSSRGSVSSDHGLQNVAENADEEYEMLQTEDDVYLHPTPSDTCK